MEGAHFRCPVKSHIHTNPDGSKITIRGLDIDEREFWDEMVQEWVKAEKKKRKAGQENCKPSHYEIPKK